MAITPELIVFSEVLLIGAGLYLAGYLTRALLQGKKTDKPSKPLNTEPTIVTLLDGCKSCINSYEGNPRGDGICKECERRDADDC
ncbi:MAG TPA: hypothetical protein GXX54_09180 [Clostridiales bacterium]|nr:hypothetical protein [Clostridiales bacterium]